MKLINVKQMAEKLCSTVGSIYTYVSTRQVIPVGCVVKIGRSVRFDEEAVDQWLNSLKKEPLPGIS